LLLRLEVMSVIFAALAVRMGVAGSFGSAGSLRTSFMPWLA
jgi:hypothetical protein